MPPKIETLLREPRILAAHHAGRTIAQVAAAENLTPTYVRRALKRYGILGPGARPVYNGRVGPGPIYAWISVDRCRSEVMMVIMVIVSIILTILTTLTLLLADDSIDT